ncbi:MAG: hypothetical protein ACI4A5_03440 [Hominilimicola sp.]
MKHKRIMCLTIIISVVFSVMPFFSALAEETEPVVTIIGSTIKNDKKYFELSMKITPGSEGFFSAGIALRYDKDVITPAAWDGTAIDMTDRTDWQNVAVIPALAPDNISGKTAMAYTDGTYGYLYLGSEVPLSVTSLEKNRVITVRFKYMGDTAEEIAENKRKVIDSFESGGIVSLADDLTASESPVGQMLLYRANENPDTEYYYTSADPSEGITTLNRISKAPEFLLEQDVESANSGGSDASKFAALVFFDWDESTLLGSMVVDSAMDTDELKQTINIYTASFMPPGTDMSEWNDETAKAYTTYNPDYPLTSHNGYTFGKWIDFNSEAFTVYGRSVDVASSGTMVDEAAPEDPDYTKIADGLVLKAAYIANETMDSLIDPGKREYTISNDPAPDAGYYGRYGNDSNFSLKFKVTRVNTDKQPVQRPRTTALRVIYNIGSTQIYSIVNMKNVDEQLVEVAAPGNAESVEVSVIDIGGVENWVADSADRATKFPVNSEKSDNDFGYVIYGTVNYINQQIAETGVTTFSGSIFTDADIEVSKGNVAGTSSSVITILRTRAVTNIRTEQEKKLIAEGTFYLSHDEMAAAVKYGDYTHPLDS